MAIRSELTRSGSAFGAVVVLAVCICSLFRGMTAYAPDVGREPAWYVSAIQSRAAAAQQYTFDAAIELAKKNGEGPRDSAGLFFVKAARAPGHKFLFWLGNKSTPQYLIVSDGQRTWGFAPAANKYVEIEAVATLAGADPTLAFPDGVRQEDVDPVLCAALVVPILARLELHSSSVVDMKTLGGDNTDAEPHEPPVLTILSNRDEAGRQRLAEIAIDPLTLGVLRFNWGISALAVTEPRFALLNVSFSRLLLGDPVPPSYFMFSPGSAEKVDELPLPGLDGRPFMNKPAPVFVFRTPNRGAVSLKDLRGRTTVLSFSAPDCEPCRQQATTLATIEKEYKDRGLVVLDAGLDNARLHGLFHVNFAPTLLVINGRGVVTGYLAGARSAAEVRALLKSSGL
jgi:thiol-disulfide isomerase/thioredoxin